MLAARQLFNVHGGDSLTRDFILTVCAFLHMPVPVVIATTVDFFN